MTARVLLVADSLAFHGPDRPESLIHPGLYPNVLAARLGARVDVVAGFGWTARDAWWALTRDPRSWSLLLPRCDAVLLAVGGMDYLPAVVPTWWREGIRYLRPAAVRRTARSCYRWAQPRGARLTRGRVRMLPQKLTDHYLSRCVAGIRCYRPDVPIVGIVPPPHDAPAFGRVTTGHAPAVAAARAWGAREGVPMADLVAAVAPHLARGDANPDGMHFGWAAHRDVGLALAGVLAAEPRWPPSRCD